MYLGYQNGKIKFYSEIALNKELYNLDRVEETIDEYILENDEYVLKTLEWEEKQKEKEKKERQEYINNLSLTSSDVERALYRAKGIDFEDIKTMLKNNPGIDIKALGIELRTGTFKRNNPYVNQIGALLGYSSDDLDYLFENKKLPEKESEEN